MKALLRLALGWGLCAALQLPAFADPSFELWSETDDDLFPSLIYATSTIKVDAEDHEPDVLGDPNGLIGILLDAPSDGATVRIEVEGNEFIRKSTFETALPEGGEEYLVLPLLKYDFRALLAVRQPTPEDVTFKVTVDGESLGELTKRFTVRSINDCPFITLDEDGDPISTAWMFAAYVNENHPQVDEILAEALDAGYVEAFAGYQGSAEDVLAELEAIWKTLQDSGFRYSNLTRASRESDTIASQHVRLLGDALDTAQANCVEGSVLLASIFQKLDMDPFLILVPGHMFVGVYLDEDADQFVCIETTLLGKGSLADAIEAGGEQFDEYEEAFEDEDAVQCEIIDIEVTRDIGILPLRELQER